MRFEWDPGKSRRNLAKQGISFESATLVFDDLHAISRVDRVEHGEARWQTVGGEPGIVVFLVAYTCYDEDGDEVIRIISARRAKPRERKTYEEAI